MQKKKKKQGFTLMEVLVTVLLIAILAGMAMPQYMKVVEKQKGTEAVNLLASIATSQERYFAVNEAYTTDFSDLDADLVDFNTRTAAEGSTYYTKYFYFQLQGDKDNTSKVVATRRGNESYVLERNYTTGDVCCKNDNTSDGDICDVLDIPNDTCAEGEEGNTGGGTTPPVTPTCSGSEPASSQTCASGCGTQTRSVTCSSGTWVTGSWTGTCSSPTQTQPTSQSCGTGGTQTRTCTATCGGGTCGSWSTCSGQGCTSTKPATTQSCGNCGTQTRSVTCDSSTGTWTTGTWGTCTGTGECSAGATRTCNTSGTQQCSSSCSWGSCSIPSCASGSTYNTSLGRCCSSSDNTISTVDGGCCVENASCGSGGLCKCISTSMSCNTSSKPTESQSCGNCNLGTQTRSVTCDTSTYTWTTGSWSTCVGGGECKAGLIQNDNVSCEYGPVSRTCQSDCTWGPLSECTPTTIECSESSKPASSQSCGNCGNQTRIVSCDTSNGSWVTGSWSTCTGQGECSPGTEKNIVECDTSICVNWLECNLTAGSFCSPSCKWTTTTCLISAGDCCCGKKNGSSGSITLQRIQGLSCADYASHYTGYTFYGCAC